MYVLLCTCVNRTSCLVFILLLMFWMHATLANPVYLLLQFVPEKRFEEVKEFVRSGAFGSYNYDELLGSLEGNEGFGRADYFLVGKDFPSYIECQAKVDEAYQDQKVTDWSNHSCLLSNFGSLHCSYFFHNFHYAI